MKIKMVKTTTVQVDDLEEEEMAVAQFHVTMVMVGAVALDYLDSKATLSALCRVRFDCLPHPRDLEPVQHAPR